MALRLLPAPKWTVPGTSGSIASGWLVYTYEPTSSTLKDTFTDSDAGGTNTNPVELDSRGEADIWWDGNYKVIVKDQNGVTVWSVDNYGEGLDPTPIAQLSLIKNYSFEDASSDPTSPDNWTITTYTNGTQSLDTTAGNQIHGAQALKFTSVGTGGGFAESDFFPVQEAVVQSVIVAMKSSSATVRNVIEILWYDRSQSLLSTSSLYDASSGNPTTWTDKSANATPPSNARYAKLRLTGCHSSVATLGSTWFDNVRVIANDFVTLTGTQTLTNKTLTSPTVTGGTFSAPAITSATGIGQAIVKRKTADETLTSNNTLQDDDHLTFAIAANEEWIAEFYIDCGAGLSITGARVAITTPAAATQNIDVEELGGTSGGAGNVFQRTTTSGTAIILSAALSTLNNSSIKINVWVLNGANAGSVTLQWCQDTSSGTALTFRKGSRMIAYRIA